MVKIELRRPAITVSAIVFGLITVWFLLGHFHSADKMGSIARPVFRYETIVGVFDQDDPDTDEKTFDYAKHNFGLVDRKYESDTPGDEKLTPWQRFEKYVEHLVKVGSAGTTYKVLYLGRHGEGFHNVAEAKYGTKAWEDYWGKLDGDGELYWFDAHLTKKGEDQAHHNNDFFKHQFAEAKMPAPYRYYSSPLYRCLQTANHTFSGLDVPDDRSFSPVIKELLREVMGEHTCDKRSTRSIIHEAYPQWTIEPGFSENDVLWQAHHRETHAEHDARTQTLLDDVFEHDGHIFISFTSHSGSIASLLRVLGHRMFPLSTGGLIPVLVKATRTS